MASKISDVARRAGVSSATVSRVLSNKPHVREEVRQRVLAAMEELQYNPDRVARSLRVQRSHIIGLVISDIQNPFFTSLVRAVEDVASQHHFGVFLCNSDEDVDKERFYIDLLRAEKAAGVIISPSRECDDPCRQLIEARVPVVVIDRRMSDIAVDTVVVDNVQATFDLVSHLISDGHHRIGAVLGMTGATTGRERQEGYLRALAAHHIALEPHLLKVGAPKEEAGYRLTGELLDLPEPPTAVFAGNNLLTVGALGAILERGLRIPDDIALVGFDKMDWMTLFQPELTVIAQPTYEIGKSAADLLLRRVQGGALPPREVVLPATLLIKHSCAYHEVPETVLGASEVVVAQKKGSVIKATS